MLFLKYKLFSEVLNVSFMMIQFPVLICGIVSRKNLIFLLMIITWFS